MLTPRELTTYGVQSGEAGLFRGSVIPGDEAVEEDGGSPANAPPLTLQLLRDQVILNGQKVLPWGVLLPNPQLTLVCRPVKGIGMVGTGWEGEVDGGVRGRDGG